MNKTNVCGKFGFSLRLSSGRLANFPTVLTKVPTSVVNMLVFTQINQSLSSQAGHKPISPYKQTIVKKGHTTRIQKGRWKTRNLVTNFLFEILLKYEKYEYEKFIILLKLAEKGCGCS